MKKRTAMFVLLMVAGGLLFAQSAKAAKTEKAKSGGNAIKSGNVMIGGKFESILEFGDTRQYQGGTELTNVSANTFRFMIAGEAGYFVFDGLEFGLHLAFQYLDQTNIENPSTYARSFTVFPGVQTGYFFETGGIFVPYGKATATYLYTNTNGSGTVTEYSGVQLRPEAGVNLFVKDNISLEAGLYLSYTYRVVLGSSPESSSSTLGGGINVGVNFFL
ncbi:MAG: outer membrane beta-barrel protein [Spirochaetales bacterium]|nr:outer membrane beta-barrel protein [Spirochaetales bacterium]